MSSIVTVPLHWTRPPLSQNDRQHHHVKAKAVAAALVAARLSIRAARVEPIPGANLTLHYRVPDHRRRDADNLAVVLKVCQDALVAEGVLRDDSWVCVPRAACAIHAPLKALGPALWLTLEPIGMP